MRIGQEEFTVVGVMGKRPSLLGGDPDEFAVIPVTTYDKLYPPPRFRGILLRFLVIAVRALSGRSRADLIADVEQIMRSRHRLKVDQENDFDILTSDLIMKIFDQLTRAVTLALVVISSIALMVGGIGVMAIMMISVTERTREIGVRKALGAKRRDILWQFLLEAVFLTALGGLLGVGLGSLHRAGRPPRHRLPGLAPVVVVRDRARFLGHRRDLLRDVPRLQGGAAGSHRSAQVRIGPTGVPGFGLEPAPRWRSSHPDPARPLQVARAW